MMIKQVVPTFHVPMDYEINDAKRLGNFRWREPFVKEYMELGFPKWKRLGLLKVSLEKLNPYVGNFLSGNSQILKTTDEAVKEGLLKKINENFSGAHLKFTLMAQAFFNAGFFSVTNGHGEMFIRYDLDKNPTTIDNSMVVVKAGSETTIVRETTGNGNLRVAMTNFSIEKGAKLKFFNVLIAPHTSLSVDSNLYTVKEGGEVEVYDVILGGEKVVSHHEFRLVESSATAKLASAYFEKDSERADLEYKLVHDAPRTNGWLNGKGVIDGESYVVFRGNICIPRGAYSVNSEEVGYTLNLSSRAQVDAIPALSVRNNAVNARHAISIGRLDENKLYYMMSRGMDKQTAIKLVTRGMFEPIVDEIPVESVKRDVENGLLSRV